MPATEEKKRWHYTADELEQALRDCGLQRGDIVLSHVSFSHLGICREMLQRQNPAQIYADAMRRVIGPEGTFITPTFTYSFCKGEIYDPATTPSTVGAFGEWLRRQPGVVRSLDPLFSCCGFGPKVNELFADLPNTAFGAGCLYERLEQIGAKVCNIGLSLQWISGRFHMEWRKQVPYRYEKLFSGFIRRNDALQPLTWIYYVRVIIPQTMPRFHPLHDLAVERGVVRQATLGAGRVNVITLHDYYDVVSEAIDSNPWFIVQGPPCDLEEADSERTGKENFAVDLPPQAGAWDMLSALTPLPRDLVSDGYDAALQALAAQLPMTIHEWHSGEPAFTWIIPERWHLHRATLKDRDGNVLLDSAQEPLCCLRYSLPHAGTVDAETLRAHLFACDVPDGAFPFVFKYYERDWGFACPTAFKQALPDGKYEVSIETGFSYGSLKVGEVIAKGQKQEGFVLCAHLDHPYQASDGLSGVVAGMEVMRRLLALGQRKYTWRLLILPETIGSAAWLSRHEALIPTLRGGLFLEMLSNALPFYYKYSNREGSAIDQAVMLALRDSGHHFAAGPCMKGMLNDERMFGAVGIGVPMGSLCRLDADSPRFAQYHTSHDNMKLADRESLESSIDVLNAAVDILEQDFVPQPLFKGELFCSRFKGIEYARHWKAIRTMTFYMDGHRSLSQIAAASDSTFVELHALALVYRSLGLIR